VQAIDVPDYKSVYYGSGNACYETDTTTTFPDPYSLTTETVSMTMEDNPAEVNGTTASVPTMGVAVNGVDIFNDSAGTNRSIYTEAGSFDRCGGHPQQAGAYHYHAEPYSITQDDDNLVGVMRDGYFVYGRRDPDGSEAGRPDGGVTFPYYGHVGVTVDSPTVPVFHYHVHFESDDAGNSGYFITPGEFYGRMGACASGCGP
jgi:hypothetical protein